MSEDATTRWLAHFTRRIYSTPKKLMDIIQMMEDDSLQALYIESNRNPRNENSILRLKADIRSTSDILNAFALGNPMMAAHLARLKQKGLDKPDQDEERTTPTE